MHYLQVLSHFPPKNIKNRERCRNCDFCCQSAKKWRINSDNILVGRIQPGRGKQLLRLFVPKKGQKTAIFRVWLKNSDGLMKWPSAISCDFLILILILCILSSSHNPSLGSNFKTEVEDSLSRVALLSFIRIRVNDTQIVQFHDKHQSAPLAPAFIKIRAGARERDFNGNF